MDRFAVMVSQARAMNLNVGIFPIAHFTTDANTFWKSARTMRIGGTTGYYIPSFANNYADLATQSGAIAHPRGGTWISPPAERHLSDGRSGVRATRTRAGKLSLRKSAHISMENFMGVAYTPGKLNTTLSFLQNTDGIYLLWSAPLATQAGASKN